MAMSESPSETRPCAAYAEEYHEESQSTVPGTRTSSQVRPRKSKRDDAGGTKSSSHAAATTGTSSGSKLMQFVGKMSATKKSSKDAAPVSPESPRKAVPKLSRRESSRPDTKLESREAAARMQLSGEPPLQRTMSNRSSEKQHPTVRPPKLSMPIPPPKKMPAARAGLIRPSSYHAGAADLRFPLQAIQVAAPMQIQRQVPIHQPLPPLSHSYQQPPVMYMASIPAPTSPNRQTTYHFPPTMPPAFLPSPWEAPHPTQFVQHFPPPISRRYSMAGPTPSAPLVEYPMVPSRPVYQHIESRPPVSFHEPSIPYRPVQDELVFIEDNEAYYRRQDQARRAMPPPPLPRSVSSRNVMAVAAPPGLVRQSTRDSIEYVTTPTSVRRESFNSTKMTRTSSSKDMQTRRSDASIDQPRRSRPQSFHSGYDRELAAEQYQADRRGSIEEPHSLTAAAIEKVNKSSRTAKTKTSESGSRSSGSKKTREVKKADARKKAAPTEAVSVEVEQGCTATVTRDASGLSVRVRSSEDNKDRTSRQSEREDQPRRLSISSRRESVPEAARIMPRRPSSSQPTSRRIMDPPSRADFSKRLAAKLREMDDTAVEDEEFSEPEVVKKRGDKLASQRVPRLKVAGESRPSSRSAQSVMSTKSNKSTKSTTSSRKGIPSDKSY